MKSSMAKFAEAMLNGLLVSVLCFLPIAWIVRDGLGPNSVESSGFEAILRCFKTFYVGPVLILLGVLKLGIRILPASRKHGGKTGEELKAEGK